MSEMHFLKISLSCNFQNQASHRERGAFYQKVEQKMQLEEALRHKSIRRKQTMHKQMKNSGVLPTSIVAEKALEAKSERDCSQKQYFEGRPKPKNEKPIGTKSDKCQKSEPKSRHLRVCGAQKVNF